MKIKVSEDVTHFLDNSDTIYIKKHNSKDHIKIVKLNNQYYFLTDEKNVYDVIHENELLRNYINRDLTIYEMV